MTQKTWARGRLGVCGKEKGTQMTFTCCPDTRKRLVGFCKKGGFNKSEIINAAIISYVERNSNVQV